MMNLPLNKINQFPSGRWGFVGSVSLCLGYVCKDGSEPTPEQYKAAQMCGPQIAGLKTRAWESREDALAAAEAVGVEVTL